MFFYPVEARQLTRHCLRFLPFSSAVSRTFLLLLLLIEVVVQTRLGQHLLRGALRLTRPGVSKRALQLQLLPSHLDARK